MTPVYSGELEADPDNQGLETFGPSTLSERIGAITKDTFAPDHFMGGLIGRSSLAAAMGKPEGIPGLDPSEIEALKGMEAEHPAAQIPREDAVAKVKESGLDKVLTNLPKSDTIPAPALQIMMDRAHDQIVRDEIRARGPGGFMAGALDVGTSLLMGAADPMNLALGMVPVVGEARFGRLAFGAVGESLLGRTAVRAGIGAARGAQFGALAAPIEYLTKTQEGQDYTFTDALHSMISGAGQFAFQHALAGLPGDVLGRIAGQPLPIPPEYQERPTAVRGAPGGVSRETVPGAAGGVSQAYDVRSGAVASKDNPGLTYIDPRIPELSPILKDKDGNPANLHKYLTIHEQVERTAMAMGAPYDAAHTDRATPAERAAVEADGVSWKAYTEEIDGYLAKIEHEDAWNPPPDPHVDIDQAIDHHKSTNKAEIPAVQTARVTAGEPPPGTSSRGGAIGPPAAPAVPAVDPVGSMIADLPERAREDVVRAAIVNMANGEPVRTGELLQAAAKADPRIAAVIEAYHGSPYDFERFDLSRVGTGEGAQSYGHGLYFAENEAVARDYQGKLGQTDSTAKFYLDRAGGDREKALAEWDNAVAKSTAELSNAEREQHVKIRQQISEGGAGKIYRVRIGANREHFLDWDKALDEQSEHVQSALQQAMGPQRWDEFKYAQAATAIKQGFIGFSDEQVSAKLRKAGIPGIKYLDQGSRAHVVSLHTEAGKYAENRFDTRGEAERYATDKEKEGFKTEISQQGTHNFVVFDDTLIRITHKNANPVLGQISPQDWHAIAEVHSPAMESDSIAAEKEAVALPVPPSALPEEELPRTGQLRRNLTIALPSPARSMIEDAEAYKLAAKKRREVTGGAGAVTVYSSAAARDRARGITNAEGKARHAEAEKAFDGQLEERGIAHEDVPDEVRALAVEAIRDRGHDPSTALDYAMAKVEREAVEGEHIDALLDREDLNGLEVARHVIATEDSGYDLHGEIPFDTGAHVAEDRAAPAAAKAGSVPQAGGAARETGGAEGAAKRPEKPSPRLAAAQAAAAEAQAQWASILPTLSEEERVMFEDAFAKVEQDSIDRAQIVTQSAACLMGAAVA
jgi:hypothetical protein